MVIGVKCGDWVGIWFLNCYEWIVIQFVIVKVGVILVNINLVYGMYELEYVMNLVGISVLVIVDSFKVFNYC